MSNIQTVADNADMIINGYAFTKDDENIRVLNLNNKKKSLYFYFYHHLIFQLNI